MQVSAVALKIQNISLTRLLIVEDENGHKKEKIELITWNLQNLRSQGHWAAFAKCTNIVRALTLKVSVRFEKENRYALLFFWLLLIFISNPKPQKCLFFWVVDSKK